jgi:protease-4
MKRILVIFVMIGMTGNFVWGQTTTAKAPSSAAATQAKEKKIVVVKLEGEITEAPPGVDIGLPDLQLNIFWDQLRLIRMVKNDATVKALVLLINQPELSMAQCQQLAMELARLRAAGKKVFIHADSIPTSLYVMALPADTIAMTPESMLEMNGLSAQILYYKDLMDKLGIIAQVEHEGSFKLFGEPYTATQPSKYMDEQFNDLLDSLYGQIIEAISKYRGLSKDRIKSILDQGPFLAGQARELKLIDEVEHRAALLERVQKQVQGKLVFDYGRTPAPPIKSGLGGLLQLFSMVGSKGEETSSNKIAVVYVTGMIMEGESEDIFDSAQTAGSETMRKAFSEIRKDEKVKAVVVRIDSPGGSSTASEIIWGVIHETAKTKPVIVSMGSVAASGGYYAAAAGDYIFASPATVTGSIGVVVGKPVMTELMKKIYIHPYTYSRGKNANLYDPFASLSAAQRQGLRDQMRLTFKTFKQRVMDGRKGKIADIDKLATGRVYTGEQGIPLGLVDKIGTLTDAVVMAADKAKIKSYQVIHLPKPKTLPELILEGLGYKVDPDDLVAAEADERMLSMFAAKRIGMLDLVGMDRNFLRQVFRIMKMMQQGKVMAISPYEIKVK